MTAGGIGLYSRHAQVVELPWGGELKGGLNCNFWLEAWALNRTETMYGEVYVVAFQAPLQVWTEVRW